MCLVYDQRVQRAGQPGCHALIVGVSNYENLGEANGPPGEFELFKLSSPALTGFQVMKATPKAGKITLNGAKRSGGKR